MKRTEDSLRDLWDNIKRANIRIIGVPEKEEKKNWLVFIKNFNVIRDQERLKNCFRLKETKET